MTVHLSLDEWEDLTRRVGSWAMWSEPGHYRYPGPQLSDAIEQELETIVEDSLKEIRPEAHAALRDIIHQSIADPTRGRELLHEIVDEDDLVHEPEAPEEARAEASAEDVEFIHDAT
ncbi:hypothetical protein ASD65_01880 [Microbacterium sp. Root61]|uniref:hypothetical protein n=1 Tax=Microbacterium sp. Root61 TaxID=1736570 RepID=UPI0006FBB0DC|nr:hypothetical protein [Microbacterium sp. Root61]KRA23306.1 hypothetical protein ASD65_01880 [Microbacterium sp. Root61]